MVKKKRILESTDFKLRLLINCLILNVNEKMSNVRMNI